jgi:hypothetical protein
MVSGVASGVGMGIGHRAVDAMMGPRQVEHVHTEQPGAAPAAKCTNEMQLLQQCLQQNADASFCQAQTDLFQQCQRA